MQTASDPQEFRARCRQFRRAGRSLGFVPTMGYLHEGHLSLVRRARAQNDVVAVSIFVNPTQFGPGEDFERYPRDTDRDRRLLEAEGADLLFLPDAGAMYPEGFATRVEVEGLTRGLCGRNRPGHFTGVATVVTKLLNLAGADRAYFGQKDYQQTVVVRRLVRDLNLDTEVVVCPTVREPDGLAMSSRNAYLSPEDRRAATVLIEALRLAEKNLKRGERSAERLAWILRERIEAEPRVTGIDYLEIVDPENLRPVREIRGPVVLAGAIRLGAVRLIDNLLIE